MSIFPCTICGECCRHISNIPELENFNNGNGICIHLDIDNNLCKIYHDRPDICKVDFMYEKYFYNEYSKEEFYQLNIEACKKLQENFSVDKK